MIKIYYILIDNCMNMGIYVNFRNAEQITQYHFPTMNYMLKIKVTVVFTIHFLNNVSDSPSPCSSLPLCARDGIYDQYYMTDVHLEHFWSRLGRRFSSYFNHSVSIYVFFFNVFCILRKQVSSEELLSLAPHRSSLAKNHTCDYGNHSCIHREAPMGISSTT